MAEQKKEQIKKNYSALNIFIQCMTIYMNPYNISKDSWKISNNEKNINIECKNEKITVYGITNIGGKLAFFNLIDKAILQIEENPYGEFGNRIFPKKVAIQIDNSVLEDFELLNKMYSDAKKLRARYQLKEIMRSEVEENLQKCCWEVLIENKETKCFMSSFKKMDIPHECVDAERNYSKFIIPINEDTFSKINEVYITYYLFFSKNAGMLKYFENIFGKIVSVMIKEADYPHIPDMNDSERFNG